MQHTSLYVSITGSIAKGSCPELWVYTALPVRENEHVLWVHWDDRSLHVSLDLSHVLRTCWLTNVWLGEIEKSTITFTIVTLPHNEWSIFLDTHLGVPLSYASRLAQHLDVLSTVALAGGYRQVADGRWYFGHEFGATQAEKNSFVNDACLQDLHCIDKDLFFETARLSTVHISLCTLPENYAIH